MEVKWICKECNSINICEKSDHMTCFVCGNEHTNEIMLHTDASSPDHLSVISGWVRSLKALSAWWKEAKLLDRVKAAEAPDRLKAIDWGISRSPSDSKEAYVKATPVYPEMPEELPDPPKPPELPDPVEPEVHAPKRRKRPTESTTTEEECLPWPEDSGSFNWDKLRACGFQKVERAEVKGAKVYRLTSSSGAQRVLSPTTMKTMGFLTNR